MLFSAEPGLMSISTPIDSTTGSASAGPLITTFAGSEATLPTQVLKQGAALHTPVTGSRSGSTTKFEYTASTS